MQQRSKLGTSKSSDEVEGLQFVVSWEVANGAFGVYVPPQEVTFPEGVLQVVSMNSQLSNKLTEFLY